MSFRTLHVDLALKTPTLSFRLSPPVCSGGHMFSGSYDKTVRVWDVDNLTCLATLQGHSGAVRALAASPTLVFSGSDDTTIKVRRAAHNYALRA